MGRGRSPTGPAEAGGPSRRREVRAVGCAQAVLRSREEEEEKPLNVQPRTHAPGPIGARGGRAAFWEM